MREQSRLLELEPTALHVVPINRNLESGMSLELESGTMIWDVGIPGVLIPISDAFPKWLLFS